MSVAATAYYPYDAGAGANITEAQWRSFMGRLAPSAILQGANNELAPSGDSTGMQVKVDTGAAWVRGAYGEWTSGVTTLPIAAVGGIPGGQSRIDSIVVRNDMVGNQMVLDVLTGTPGASPSAPALTQSSSMWETLLGNVGSLTNATSTITAAMVSDGRWKMTPSGVLYHEQNPTGATLTVPGAGTIPGGYPRLRLSWYGRTTSGNNVDIMTMTFNGDSGANYDYFLQDYGAAYAQAISSAQTSARAGALAGGALAAGLFNAGWIEIFNYAATGLRRVYQAQQFRNDSAAGAQWTVGSWRNTANAITSVLLTPAAGSFATNSKVVTEVGP